MAKLVAGVKSFKSISFVSVPVNVTQYRTSNGRTYSDAIAANKAQERINLRDVSIRLSQFLTANGLTPSGNQFGLTTHCLAKALTNPKLRSTMMALAG